MNYLDFYQPLLTEMAADARFAQWAERLPADITDGLSETRFGDLPQWRNSYLKLPDVTASLQEFKDRVQLDADIPERTRNQIEQTLRELIPWRKGPYELFGFHLNTEWRSDWKWDRVAPHLADLTGRNILDVGCGNGYHCWRMYGAGARRVIGIDPSPRFVMQFYSLKHFIGNAPVDVLPIGIEQLPEKLGCFDTTFSMGVLYHRRSPMDHLRELRETLRAGGQLVLETLVIEGKLGEVLVPEGRYAKMNNVWFLPSPDTLLSWLKKCGFQNPRMVEMNTTSLEEQRTTDWMLYHSLNEFLDPDDKTKTAEGHPAPIRATFIAEAPG
ncbi:tRNA 5-methoxyuridine(34)/uridine 5-oxyacetic acid(34) synthase CmoB [Simiduia sp. 21SJ11W-1]|uniref:tRNA 5-methoxyuridine(34)/uridine 5-oxyacetic acid(34) synthase CmoB n=1 Tax=Simiduia sp. 21SJ11W-1 TaxID=2909669 RepID=UPI0020A20A61|nr:tRNA 5-methoxyuridine(34)/uridine 5-oxyacetic acid(34) synthase CmoB [Simiduia sp. 21SJ11W-1]UTA46515.1 tRNA 5-methoxyuridine(34)/uridine 5-oxyacetic acid(34) synthase CmoB [Simiduia sp. 21SJ11W-1]